MHFEPSQQRQPCSTKYCSVRYSLMSKAGQACRREKSWWGVVAALGLPVKVTCKAEAWVLTTMSSCRDRQQQPLQRMRALLGSAWNSVQTRASSQGEG